MRCVLCSNLSLKAICGHCANKLLSEERKNRTLDNGFKVYSFFNYSSIAPILHAKHHFWGHRVLRQIAKLTFSNFAKEFYFAENIAAIGVDDAADSNYSHTAILARALKSKSITPVYSALRATSKVRYSGKSYNFRRSHPRNFSFKQIKQKYAILVDDVITSGLTLQEASECLKTNGVTPLFALTLADARDN